jgi:hypothetical protein
LSSAAKQSAAIEKQNASAHRTFLVFILPPNRELRDRFTRAIVVPGASPGKLPM